VSQQADKFSDSIAAALGETKPAYGSSQFSGSAPKADDKIGGSSLEQRLNAIIEERERVERDQAKLRGEAEQELKRIVPEIDSLQKQIENLRSRKQSLEGFLQRMAPKGAGEAASPSAGQAAAGGQSPSLRRASFG
jgi:archaellum component FlaC